MTDVENLVLEHLRALRNAVTTLTRRVDDGFAQVNIRLSAVEQQLTGLTTAVYGGHSRINDLERRVERIERRLELHDEVTP
jgi:hypothetical protein